MKTVAFKYLTFCVLNIIALNICLAEGLNITINPLLNYHQQLQQLKKECNLAGYPAECKKRFNDLSREIDTLRRYCETNSNDFRCDALERKRNEVADPLEELCSRDPYATKCVRKREAQRQNTIQMAKYCKTRPESSRCRPKPPAKKREPYLVSFCRDNPTKKMCVKYIEEEKLRKDPYYKEDKANVF